MVDRGAVNFLSLNQHLTIIKSLINYIYMADLYIISH